MLSNILNVVVVQPGGAEGGGVLKPKKEGHLEEEIEGNEGEDESSVAVDDRDGAEDNPVGEPLFIITIVIGLKSKETLESGVCDGNGAGNVAFHETEHHKCDGKVHGVLGGLCGLDAESLFNFFHFNISSKLTNYT